MTARIGDFYLCRNSVIVNFNMCDYVTLNNIHSTYGDIETRLDRRLAKFIIMMLSSLLRDLNCLVLALY